MAVAMFVASALIWKLAPALALKLTLPDPPPFERIDVQVVGK
ncbi:MAG: hypothetical protein ACRDJE_15735 [Dehalococcoidia bacterium]